MFLSEGKVQAGSWPNKSVCKRSPCPHRLATELVFWLADPNLALINEVTPFRGPSTGGRLVSRYAEFESRHVQRKTKFFALKA